MSGNSNKTIAFNYFGGKFTWVEHLYANFPPPNKFMHLVDLFAGSMVVSLNYHGRVIRTANEINGEITNFFVQIRDHEEELEDAMRAEAGDVLWQIAGLCHVMGWDLEMVAQENLEKLRDRQARQVIIGDGDNR